jgi:hypothetical protein
MTRIRVSLLLVSMSVVSASAMPARKQAAVRSADAAAFIGTGVFAMTNPQGVQETVRIVDNAGALSGTVQAGRFPPVALSGILRDGDMLVLAATRFENGKPIRAVISRTPNGDSMNMARCSRSARRPRGPSRRSTDGRMPLENDVLQCAAWQWANANPIDSRRCGSGPRICRQLGAIRSIGS